MRATPALGSAMKAMAQRVVVTGMGLVSPLGADETVFFDRIKSGRSAVRRLTAFDTAPFKTVCGAEIDDAVLAAARPSFVAPATERVTALSLAAAWQALTQAGLRDPAATPPFAPLPVATLLGSGIGPAYAIEDAYRSYFEKGARGPRPTAIPRSMANAPASQISMQMALTGANYVLASACASSTVAIGNAFRMIRHGYADIVLCGGAESVFAPGLFSSWNNLGVMSRNSDPACACRPFDRDRDGFVLGEGAALLTLEGLDHARARGARIRAEIIGYGESSDAGHITRPDPQGQANALRHALRDADLGPAAVAYINAHGTATKANDLSESQSIRIALGAQTDAFRVSSCKSFFGHLLGAAGAMETVATVLALEQRVVPPNPNLEHVDPECAIPLAGRQCEPMRGAVALNNSFGFGGGNAVLALRRWDG
jgi:3-oxoacyl-(acyl-carrier-protein) synthase